MEKKVELNFEEKMNKLNEIVSEMEKDNTSLDKSLDLYKQGLQLSKELKQELSEFEKKVDEINGEDNE